MTGPTVGSNLGDSARLDGRYRVGLAVFGVLEILAGLFLGVSAAVLAASAAGGGTLPGLEGMAGSQGSGGTIALAAGLYAALAALLVALGVGSLLPRRWVRPLVLFVSSLWLLAGLLLFVVIAGLAMTMGASLGSMSEDAESPLGGIGSPLVVVALLFVFFVLYVVFPAALFVFHRLRGLKAALERLDPVTRWTDRCPAPVLSLSLSLAISAAGCLPFVRGPLPLFGLTLTGAAAFVVVGIATITFALLAIATYRLAPIGWWGSLVTVVILTIVSVDVSFRFDPSTIGADLIGPSEHPAPDAAGAVGWLLGAGSLLFGAVCLVAVLRLRRDFFPSADR